MIYVTRSSHLISCPRTFVVIYAVADYVPDSAILIVYSI